jgi:hypothetical protein
LSCCGNYYRAYKYKHILHNGYNGDILTRQIKFFFNRKC